jgi:hypothetical protein
MRRLVTFIGLCLLFPPGLLAKSRSTATQDSGYGSALAMADRFLQAWQAGDVENGMVLLSSHAKESATAENVESFFSDAGAAAFEITRGKLLKRDRYAFPVVLISGNGSKNGRVHRRFCRIVVVNTGHNDWAVDKLP